MTTMQGLLNDLETALFQARDLLSNLEGEVYDLTLDLDQEDLDGVLEDCNAEVVDLFDSITYSGAIVGVESVLSTCVDPALYNNPAEFKDALRKVIALRDSL